MQCILNYFCRRFLFPFLFRSTSFCLSDTLVENADGEEAHPDHAHGCLEPCYRHLTPTPPEHPSCIAQTPKHPILNLGPSVQPSKQPSSPKHRGLMKLERGARDP